MSDSLWPHGLQHARLPCPSLSPGFAQTHVHWVGDAWEMPLSEEPSGLQPMECKRVPESWTGLSEARDLGKMAGGATERINSKFSSAKVLIQWTADSWKEVKVKVTQLCPTLCKPTVHGILQARILEWVAFPFSSGSSQPRDRTQPSYTAGGFFTSWVCY